MQYPRIYSLSTVGILKHYNQDYLLHRVRTDFTGNNGVGKSIIADLLQLIFISDKGLVVFGTEGLRKGDRLIHSLPYECSEAYAFLNVEIKKDLFVVIGVCIPSSQSRRLRSFIILNQANDQGSVDEIAIPKDKIVTWHKFIDKGKIPTIEDLTKHLRDKHKLFLSYYSFKEEKNNYYNFLFSHKILPINLSIEDNLETFARIIQSFSRARSLDVNNSNSLKKFLFEDNEKQFARLFQLHKGELERLLNDFKSLKDYIEQLESKQADLSGLKLKESRRVECQRIFLQTELSYVSQLLRQAESEHGKIFNQVDEDRKKHRELAARSPRLKSLIKTCKELLEKARTTRDALLAVRAELNEFASVTNALQTVLKLKYPTISGAINRQIDITRYDTSEIERRVTALNTILEVYKSVAAMDQMCNDQTNQIERRKSAIQNEIQTHEEIVRLIELGKDRTLFAQAIRAGRPLSEQQETVLLSFLAISWGRPDDATDGAQYTDSLDLLDEKMIEPTDAGFWLKLGHLNKFYLNSGKKRLLANADNLKNAVKEKLASIKQSISDYKSELIEIERFQRGDTFDKDKIKIDLELDQRLRDFSALDYYKDTAKIVQEIATKIASLKERQLSLQTSVTKLKDILPEPTPENVAIQVKKLEQYVLNGGARFERFNKVSVQEETKIDTLKNVLLPMHEETLKEKLVSFNRAKTDLIEKQTQTENIFPDLKPDLQGNSLSQKMVEDQRELFNSARENYVTDFKTIVAKYEESRARKNAEINEQLDDTTYSFTLLEKVLLGPKIKHVDNISNELRSSNQQRLTMAETIHETMLKIFSQTKSKFDDYRRIVRELNTFFKGKKISNRYYFQIQFKQQSDIDIEWISKLQASSQRVSKRGEIPFGDTVEKYVEDFFKKATNVKKTIAFAELLDPKTYFDLSVCLTNENNKEIPGSTGETYSAIVLLGIGRLSIVQDAKRPGIKFIILEETANLDRVNFSTFPNIAEEFGYQIFTMTPKPYGSDSDAGWYLHHMFPGVDNPDINYHEVASYFKTNEDKKDLKIYLESIKES